MTVTVRVGVRFEAGEITDPVLAEALRALRAFEVEAPSLEAGEHFAQQLTLALERTANGELK